jgi:capsular exopolysaccharide synthesis family protein
MNKQLDLMQQLQAGPPVRSEAAVESLEPVLHWRGRNPSQWVSDETVRLVQQIFLLQTQAPPRMVVFAGVDHGNGCSGIAASVAKVLARAGSGPVCLVEGNFRSPTLPELFGTINHHGLTDALLGQGPIRSFAKPVGMDKLWLLSCGKLAIDSPNLLSSNHIKARLAELRSEFDFVVIDAPPLTQYADAIAIGQVTDGVVLVIEADSTRREAAQAAVANLRCSQVPILGAVLNKRSFPIPKSIYDRL